MSEYLLFWPKAAAMAYVPSSNYADIYSKALPTHDFTEVVSQLECDAQICGDGNTSMTVYPQISNDGVNWKELTGFSVMYGVGGGTTFPVKEMMKITDIGAFMRMRIKIAQGASNANAGGTLLISGAGRF